MSMQKPTFGSAPQQPGVTPTVKVEGGAESSTEKKPSKPEVGAIWKHTSQKGTEYLKMTFSRKELQSVLGKNSEDRISLIAFSNKDHNGQNNRPNFRIFEETEKKG